MCRPATPPFGVYALFEPGFYPESLTGHGGSSSDRVTAPSGVVAYTRDRTTQGSIVPEAQTQQVVEPDEMNGPC